MTKFALAFLAGYLFAMTLVLLVIWVADKINDYIDLTSNEPEKTRNIMKLILAMMVVVLVALLR